MFSDLVIWKSGGRGRVSECCSPPLSQPVPHVRLVFWSVGIFVFEVPFPDSFFALIFATVDMAEFLNVNKRRGPFWRLYRLAVMFINVFCVQGKVKRSVYRGRWWARPALREPLRWAQCFFCKATGLQPAFPPLQVANSRLGNTWRLGDGARGSGVWGRTFSWVYCPRVLLTENPFPL